MVILPETHQLEKRPEMSYSQPSSLTETLTVSFTDCLGRTELMVKAQIGSTLNVDSDTA
jgi:hypothetical protein